MSGPQATALRLLRAFGALGCLLLSTCRQGLREDVTLAHWGHEKVFIYFPLYVAQQNGYFADEGINLRIQYAGNDDQVFAAVLGGSAQVGAGDPVFAAISREKGGPGRVVATLVSRVSNWGIARDSHAVRITDMRQLNGKRVSSFPSPSTAFTILSDIKTRYHLEDMRIVELAPGTELAALQRGDVDIALTGEPAVSRAESEGYPVVLSLGRYYGPFTFSGITTTDQVIASRPWAVQAVVSGLQRAVEFIKVNPDSATSLVAVDFPDINRKVIEAAIHRMERDSSLPEDVRIEDRAWRRTLEMRRAMGDIHSDSVGAAVDNSFADSAVSPSSRLRLRNERLHPATHRSTASVDSWVWLSRTADIVGIFTFLGLTLLLGLWNATRPRKALNEHVYGARDRIRAAYSRADNTPLPSGQIVDVIQGSHLTQGQAEEILAFFLSIRALRRDRGGLISLRRHPWERKRYLIEFVLR